MKSIEEKAKAYDGLIERLKDLKFAYRFSPLSDTIEDIFPELAESEDERIRKEMIFYFTEEIPQCSIQEHANKMKKFIAWLEKQGEQKPAEVRTTGYWNVQDIEQNPAWSEEDDAVLNALIRRLEGEDVYVSPHLAVECLKSLRPQNHWKPSERQKEALLWCVVHLGGADKQTLGELLEELNKL